MTSRSCTSRNPKCLEIWMCHLGSRNGSIQSGCRPVCVLSNNKNNRYSTTLNVVPLTTKMNKRKLPIHVELWNHKDYGLSAPSTMMVEQITTVSIDDLDYFIGSINDEETISNIVIAIQIQFPIMASSW